MLRDALVARFPALTKLPPRCYVVGGAIRDLLLGIEPADVDVACDDPLAAARAVRDKVIRLGDGEELTAYRVAHDDRIYDFAAIVGGSIDTDLARRDFTINAMALDLERDALLDPHGGRRDLDAGVVRMVRPSNFDDDPLRLLKAVRMAVKLGFTLDGETLEAIAVRAPRITEPAQERITTELSIIFSSNAFRRAVDLLRRTRLDEPLGLRTRDFHADDVTLAGAYALLTDEPRLREAKTLQALLERHDPIALYDAGEAIARQLPPLLRALGRDDAIAFPDFSIRALLSGEEIGELTGLPPGKELGRIKRELLEAQVRGELATRDEAAAFVTASARRPPHPS